MDTFSAVIDAFGGPAAFGEAIGVPDSHARTMKARDSIPAAHWQRVVAASIIKNIPGISLEALVRLAAKPAPQHERAGAA